MSKYPCGLIEDLIPLYIEDDVNEETKEIVEVHLKECENCSLLLEEYTNANIKYDELKDDLPKSNTFKKWMKKLKIWGSVLVVSLIAIAITIGTLGYKAGKTLPKELLTQKIIVKTLRAQGLSLKEDKQKSPDDFDLSGVKPAVYSIGERKDTLLIYTFKSFLERDKILMDTKKYNNPFNLEEIPYKAKNSLLVFMPSPIPKDQEEYFEISRTTKLLSDVVFKYLNDGKEIVYKGTSENWEGTFTLKYYEHWFQDETGKLHYDNYSEVHPVIKYKMSDIANVGPITFEYETLHSSGKSTGLTLHKDGYANAGSSGGNGAIPRENEDIKFTIKWGDKEEHIVLKPQ